MKISLVLCCGSALAGFAGAENIRECPADEQEDQTLTNFKPCHVDDGPSFTDYQRVGLLEPFISQWNWYLKRDKVPSLTEECKGGTAAGCERGSIDWTAAANSGSARQVVIDTDFENEVDDYVAVAWALLSSVGPSAQVNITSIVVAPFSFRYRFLPLVQAQLLGHAQQIPIIDKRRMISFTVLLQAQAPGKYRR